jgi:hypothetical protein
MSNAARKIVADAVSLPEPERAEVVAEILASFDGEPDPDWESAWRAELQRRSKRADEGAPMREWSEVRSRIEARLRKK